MKLIFATHNPGKIKEMQELLAGSGIEVLSADEAGVNEDVVEDGLTFEENALKKARFVCKKTGECAVADDSGICINALNGAPGVFTARWAGEGNDLIDFTLNQIKDIVEENLGAQFRCFVALVKPDGQEFLFEGRSNGRLIKERRGTAHPKLPYDQIFIPEGHIQTFAEMSHEEKHELSHRGQAFKKLKDFF
ncbi:MAG: Non-canonical purine NTP pyrophosphatase [Candidatus Uhrbacteria bacterium GW2011_GWE2_45_35]|uniref:dITP/XTP pyrophosphatase n=2 Tax=Candidatus Uhriibacteriota TaxID=1752732 RepID=A0A0G1JK03_9BACT|nr:MAG: Non-canonical purine NTP pyrophosphatase [Candidatus Uhrbacteria bacterium GW2011_GWF2_44_350]KKU08395.1 MAG: Non-canonical purine NTP pyrophosphatase [Candidatus Uhrbacteria bacterium GW2011_GWE2_45_35]